MEHCEKYPAARNGQRGELFVTAFCLLKTNNVRVRFPQPANEALLRACGGS